MLKKLKILSKKSALVYEKKPGFLMMNGAFVVLGFIVLYLLFSNQEKASSDETLYELFFEVPTVNEEDYLAEKELEVYQVFSRAGDTLNIGDTILQFHPSQQIINVTELSELINETSNLKTINWLSLSKRDYPVAIVDQLRKIDKVGFTKVKTYSKKTKELILRLEADIDRASKEKLQLEQSIPIFEKLLAESKTKFEIEKQKYSKNDTSITVADLKVLKEKVSENEDFLRLRKRSLQDEIALIRNHKSMIINFKGKQKVQKIATDSLSNLIVDFKIKMARFNQESYLLADKAGLVKEIIKIGTYKEGDQLLLIESEVEEVPSKLYVIFPNELWDRVEEGDEVTLVKEILGKKEYLKSRVIKKSLPNNENAGFKVHLDNPENLNPQNELIISAKMKRSNSSDHFFKSLWANFKI